jgi:SNF2 family DNA or RNA helicase
MANPFLVIVPSNVMEDWSHALEKLMPETNIIIYAGSKEAREIIQKYEFYNDDGVCMVQIALTTFDTLNLVMYKH